MKHRFASLMRFAVTALAACLAIYVGIRLWDYYMDAPWTRDGHVRADVVPVAPDVSGFVTEVLVQDNLSHRPYGFAQTPRQSRPGHERPAEPDGTRSPPSCGRGSNHRRKGCEQLAHVVHGHRRPAPEGPAGHQQGKYAGQRCEEHERPRLGRQTQETAPQPLATAFQRRPFDRQRAYSCLRSLAAGHHVYYHTLDLITVNL